MKKETIIEIIDEILYRVECYKNYAIETFKGLAVVLAVQLLFAAVLLLLNYFK